MLRNILLGFLNYQSMTGYALKAVMEQSTMHFWHAYHSQIYTTLRKLEEEGLLTSEEEETGDKLNRRTYTITETGRAALNEWLGVPLTTLGQSKEDLLVRLFFSGQRDKAAVLNELRLHRQLHQQQLAEYQKMSDGSRFAALANESTDDTADAVDIGHEMRFWLMTLNFGMRYEQMYLDWLDMVIEAVER